MTNESSDALVFSDRSGSYYLYVPDGDATAEDVEGFLRDPSRISAGRVPPDRSAGIEELLTGADTYGYAMSDFPGADTGPAADLEFRGQVTISRDLVTDLGTGDSSDGAPR